MAEHPARGVLIGEEALYARGCERLFVDFFGPECDLDASRHPITLFVRKLQDDLVSNGLVSPGWDVRWVFSAPSKWTRQRRSEYRDLLRSAGFTDVSVVPEWRAILLYARYSGDADLDVTLLSGAVLIVDVGRWSVDCALTLRGRPLLLPSNAQLGTRHLDTAIMDRVLRDHPDIEDLLEADQDDDQDERRRLELRCRKAREAFFRTDPSRFIANPDELVRELYVLETPLRQPRRQYVPIELSAHDMDEVMNGPLPALGGKSWREVFESDLVTITLTESPDIVLLTGEEAHMYDAVKIASDVFGAERVRILTWPEHVVARGLALAYGDQMSHANP